MATIHSIERAKERFGYNAKYTEHFIRNAVNRGKSSSDFKKRAESEWLNSHSRSGCTAYAYNGACLIISKGDACVTLYKLPGWFDKKPLRDGKTKVRCAMKYQRMNRAWN